MLDVTDDSRAQFSSMKYDELAETLMDLQRRKRELEISEAAIQKQIDIITTETIPDKMAEDGFRSVNLAGGGSIRLSPQAYCSTRAGMKQALFHWLEENDFGELVTEVVNPSTLKAFIKEQLEMGNPVPSDEIINWQPYIRASVVGMKNR